MSDHLVLSVGRTYINRLGESVKIVRQINSDHPVCTDDFTFVGDDSLRYSSDGRFWGDPGGNYDLTEEVMITAEPVNHPSQDWVGEFMEALRVIRRTSDLIGLKIDVTIGD